MSKTLRLGRTVTPQGVMESAQITITGGRICELREGGQADDRFAGLWAIPGYVDTHCHGGAGVDFSHPDVAKVAAAINYHRSHGSTTLFASTVTEAREVLIDQVSRLADLVEAGELAGIHLEGPFLAEARKGAHNSMLLADPAPDYVQALLGAGRGAVKMVTLAPERSGGFEAIAQFSAANVAVAFGHSDADAAITKASVDAGAGVVTHLFNAMRPIHHREPGPIPELLKDDRVMVELICDGVHLHPDVVALAIKAAGIHRVALITDAMSATGSSDGNYLLGTLEVQVRNQVARLVDQHGCAGAIAGSTLSMDKAVEFVITELGCSVAEASQMASTTPASWHGLSDVGELSQGKWADLCFIDDHGALKAVMRRGEWVKELNDG